MIASPGTVLTPGATALPPLPRGAALRLRQILGVLRLELRKSFLRPGALPVVFLALAPVAILVARALLYDSFHHGDSPSLGSDTAAAANIYQAFVLRLGIFFGSVGIFTHLFRGEILGRTLHHYFLAPMPRSVLVVGKYLAGLLASWLLFLPTTALIFWLVYLPHGEAGSEYLFHGAGWPQLLAYLSVTALACLGYGAVFLTAGLLFRNPFVPAAAVFGWEMINFLLPPMLKKISVLHYLQSLCPVAIEHGPFSFPAEPTPAWLAVGGVIAVSAALIWIAAAKAARSEVLYGGE
jgi:ABC-type transport system involved in multi-copper enzyme maturation permease subunit